MTQSRCQKCGYVLMRDGSCPICDGRQVGTRADLPTLPVTRAMFQTAQHYDAWRAGAPLRTQRARRWKVPLRWKEAVKQHYGYRCQWPNCGTRDSVTLEHIVPVVLGGSNEPANLTLLCSRHQADSFARFRDVLKLVDQRASA